MTKWNEIRRSDKPFDYKKVLENVCLTRERFNNFINNELEKRKMLNVQEEKSENEDEDIDMDEKSSEDDDSEVNDEGEEPDSSIKDED